MTEQEVNQKAKQLFIEAREQGRTRGHWESLGGGQSYWRYLARRAAWSGPKYSSVAEYEEAKKNEQD